MAAGHNGILICSDASVGVIAAASAHIQLLICSGVTLTGGDVSCDRLTICGFGTFDGASAVYAAASVDIKDVTLSGDLEITTTERLSVCGCSGVLAATLAGSAATRSIVHNTLSSLTLSGAIEGTIVSTNTVSLDVTLSSNASQCSVLGNRCGGDLKFIADVTDTIINNNQAAGIEVSGDIDGMDLCGNRFVSSSSSAVFQASVSQSSICANLFAGACTIVGVASLCVINNNRFQAGCEVGTASSSNPTECTLAGNLALGAITTHGSARSNKNILTGNRATGGFSGWSTFLTSGFPNDMLITGLLSISVIGSNRT